MYAIAFDMVIADLKEYYGEPYNNAYFEIGQVLRNYGFYNTRGSVYLTNMSDMVILYRAIEALKKSDDTLLTAGLKDFILNVSSLRDLGLYMIA